MDGRSALEPRSWQARAKGNGRAEHPGRASLDRSGDAPLGGDIVLRSQPHVPGKSAAGPECLDATRQAVSAMVVIQLELTARQDASQRRARFRRASSDIHAEAR